MRKPVRTTLPWLLAMLATSAIVPASAATAQAWTAHDRSVREACLAASGLERAKVVGAPVAFDDASGQTALLLSGRYPRPKKKHLSGRELCLFDRKTGTAQVADADRMGSARQ